MTEISAATISAQAQGQLMQEVSLRTMRLALDQQQQSGDAAIQLLQQAAEVAKTAPTSASDGVGQNLNLLA
ncbi:MAG: putative motility protein [Phycisphaeraceae bacterium]